MTRARSKGSGARRKGGQVSLFILRGHVSVPSVIGTQQVCGERETDRAGSADANHHGAKPAPSKWRLRGDACARLKEQPAENMSAAGRWMFEDARDRGELTDMQFLLDSGRRIRGHKSWLMARCEYIRCMLSGGMQEGQSGVVRVRECSEGVFVVILEFLYTGELGDVCLGQDWMELWGIADLFGCEEMCSRLLHAVTVGNVEEAAQLAVETGMRPLMERCAKVLHSKTAGGDEARSFIRTLNLLCECGDDYCWQLVGKWLTSAIEFVIRTHISDELVCRGGLLILRRFAESSGWQDGSISVEVAVIKELTEVVILGFNKHRANAAIQEHGFAFLRKCLRSEFFESVHDIFLKSGGVRAAVEALKAYKANVQVQAHVCGTLSLNACCDPEYRTELTFDDIFVEVGGLEAIVEVLKIHTNDDGVQECGCEIIHHLCFDVMDWKSRACDAGAVEAIAEALKAHYMNRNQSGVLGEACYALIALCTDDDTKDPGDASSFELLHRGRAGSAIEAIVRGMDQSSFGQHLCGGFDLLSCLCQGVSSNAHRAVEAGAMKTCVAALTNLEEFDGSLSGPHTELEVHTSVCEAMCSILLSDAENLRSAVLDAGGLKAVCELFQHWTTAIKDEGEWYDAKWNHADEILEFCCHFLSTMLDEKPHEKCRRLALSLDAVTGLELAVRQRPNNRMVQEHGRMALKRLGEYVSPSVLGHFRPVALRGPYFGIITLTNLEEAAHVAVKNGMRPLMERCVNFLPLEPKPHDLLRAESLLRIMELLCKSGDSKSRQIVRPRLYTVVEVMRQLPSLANMGLFVLRHATCSGDYQLHYLANRDMFTEKNWADTVIHVLDIYPNSAAVQEHGFATLANCMDDQDRGYYGPGTVSPKKWHDSKATMIKMMKSAANALKTHEANAQVQEQVCRALIAHLGRLEFAKFSRYFFNGGGLEAIVEALGAHRDTIGVQDYGCRAIGILCCDCDEYKNFSHDAGAVEAIVEVLKMRKSNRRILLTACNELIKFCCVGLDPFSDFALHYPFECRARAGEAGCVEAIVEAVEAHSTNGQVLETCFELLSYLCDDKSDGYYNALRALGAGAILTMNRTLRDLDTIHFQCDCVDEDDLVYWMFRTFQHVFVQTEAVLLHPVLDVAGGIEAIVHFLKFFSKDDDDESCWPCDDDDEPRPSLWDRSDHTSSKIIKLRMRMSRANGISTTSIIAEASWSGDTEQVDECSCSKELEQCCLMLERHLNVMRHHDCRLALSLDVMPALHAAVRQHPNNIVVQRHGRMLLKRLGEYVSPSVLGHFRPVEPQVLLK